MNVFTFTRRVFAPPLLATVLALGASFLVPFVAQAALYAPGATLDPACFPTDPPSSCGITSTVGTGIANNIPYYATNGTVLSATSTLTILPIGNFGVGTSTPWADFSIGSANSATLMPLFAVASSSASVATSTLFVINGNGNVGIGTSTPGSLFSIQGIANFTIGTTTFYGNGINIPTNQCFAVNGTCISGLTAIGANTILANQTGASAIPTALATSSLFAAGAAGNVLYYTSAGTWVPGATSTLSTISGSLALTQMATQAANTILGNLTGGVAAPTAFATSSLFAGTIGQNAYFSGTGTLVGTSTLFTATSGNIGIGTTTPQWNLQVVGTRPSIALSDTSAGANLKHWVFSSMGGNFYLGTSTDAYGTSTPAALTILPNGDMGIGTTTPGADFAVTNENTTGPSFLVATNANANATQLIVTGTGNLGIGTSSPWGLLSVNANAIGIAPQFVVGSSTGTNLIVTNGGNVGIGTTTPATRFEVGTSTAPDITMDWYTNCTAFATNANGLFSCSASDQRLKQEITPLDASSTLAALGALNPVSFYWRPGTDRGTQQQYGFIAQQVADVFPNLVSTTSPTALTPGGTLTVNYDGLIAPMVIAIQQLAAEVSHFAQSMTTNVLTAVTGNFTHVKTQDLCVGSTCITESQLQGLLQQSGQQASQPSAPASLPQTNPAAASSTNPISSTTTPPASDTIASTDSSASTTPSGSTGSSTGN